MKQDIAIVHQTIVKFRLGNNKKHKLFGLFSCCRNEKMFSFKLLKYFPSLFVSINDDEKVLIKQIIQLNWEKINRLVFWVSSFN